MHIARRTAPLFLLVAMATGLVLTGCSNDPDDGAIMVKAADTKCEVSTTSAKAGRVTFQVRNNGSKVTEFYIYATKDRIMGEVENIGPGVERKLIVDLSAGAYQTACKPGMKGDGIRGKFTVTGKADSAKSVDKKTEKAVARYETYVAEQARVLVDKTTEFVAAVNANDAEHAKSLYPVARTYYERIEPVAESFGDLDRAIDERKGDVSDGEQFTGFHRLEMALWQDNDISGMNTVANDLLDNVKKIAAKANEISLTPMRLANGSKSLLDEVATKKVSGEEDEFSHTDLWDFRANVDGSQAAINALRDVLAEREPALLKNIDKTFSRVDTALATYRSGEGYVSYTSLSQQQVKDLASTVDAVSEPVSKVPDVIAK